MLTKRRATVQDLYNVPEDGKAELVNGELVIMGATGGMPGRASMEIAFSLRAYEGAGDGGFAIPDNVGFLVDLPNRESFSPDAAWYVGDVESMKFLQGAPVFAVEVRSEGDYGPAAERAITDKITDYFAAGTRVVWDVDLLGEETIRKYSAANPTMPTIFRRGDIADAEPAVPGWQFSVNKLFLK